jgi:NADPH:quinone reductase-like Zn-dependent oxidoreductase
LIYGGSTATGSLGIQFAALAGYRVLTTCSSSKTSFVTSLGAEKAFDYTSPTCGKAINEYTKNKLMYVWDTISEAGSAKICAEALSSQVPEGEKARYGTILPVKIDRDEKEVQTKSTLSESLSAAKLVIRTFCSCCTRSRP